MSGFIPHLLAGAFFYFVGRIIYSSYFTQNKKRKLQLAAICLTFSLIPDVFLGLYYTTGLLSFKALLPYHVITHLILTPAAIILLTVLALAVDTKRRPIWIMGIAALLLHIIMDSYVPETSFFI